MIWKIAWLRFSGESTCNYTELWRAVESWAILCCCIFLLGKKVQTVIHICFKEEKKTFPFKNNFSVALLFLHLISFAAVNTPRGSRFSKHVLFDLQAENVLMAVELWWCRALQPLPCPAPVLCVARCDPLLPHFCSHLVQVNHLRWGEARREYHQQLLLVSLQFIIILFFTCFYDSHYILHSFSYSLCYCRHYLLFTVKTWTVYCECDAYFYDFGCWIEKFPFGDK